MNTPTTPTFYKHGKDWFPHTPGDPCPVEPTVRVCIVMRADYERGKEVRLAGDYRWSTIAGAPKAEIIGWRYADPRQESAESVTDELTRLREENANMRTAIQYAHEALTCVRCLEATDIDLKRAALAKLQPFTQL